VAFSTWSQIDHLCRQSDGAQRPSWLPPSPSERDARPFVTQLRTEFYVKTQAIAGNLLAVVDAGTTGALGT
jgi:hypothetical protein